MVRLKCIFRIESTGCICCVPSDFTKEGDADERDGSINISLAKATSQGQACLSLATARGVKFLRQAAEI